jgi:hypothetical protein
MTIQIAVDPGRNTGWVAFHRGHVLATGTLKPNKVERSFKEWVAARQIRFSEILENLPTFFGNDDAPELRPKITEVCIEAFRDNCPANRAFAMMKCEAYAQACQRAAQDLGIPVTRKRLGYSEQEVLLIARQHVIKSNAHVRDALALGHRKGWLK